MLEFHHIMDKQPDNKSAILQIDRPYRMENSFRKTDYLHSAIGMRIYECNMPFEEMISWNKENNWPLPDYFWCYVADFYNEYPMLRGDSASSNN